MRYIVLGLSILALIIASGWVIASGFDYEPLIVFLLGLAGIISHFTFIKEKKVKPENSVDPKPLVEANLGINEKSDNEKIQAEKKANSDRESIIEIMKSNVRILFIDDDTNFNVVKILKDSGWKWTKAVIDIKGIDIPKVKEADIYFVDINGVGKLLNCKDEGLDIALMLKQKYPMKKVVIYSANRKNTIFHDAWEKCDFKLEKNALPYQFQSLVEKYSIELHKEK